MRTLSNVIERLISRGYTAHFGVVGDRLRAFDSGKTFEAHEVIIRAYQRFEGVSDPDDMAIVYAIESTDGTRGSLVDAFGAYANPTVSAFLHDVQIRPAAETGAVGSGVSLV
jgi:hypothetical protein